MEYWTELNTKLKPWIDRDCKLKVVDLFAGCGGLSLGFEANGFQTIGYEMEDSACKTYNDNLIGDCKKVKLSNDPEYKFPKAEIVVGGPPCQPFSVGGKQRGLKDSRDGFPIFISAIKNINPKVFLFENVRGMFYRNKLYLKEILSELKSLGYKINFSIMNALDFEVPQNRERLIVIGAKKEIELPNKVNRRVIVRDALGELADQYDENSKFFTESMDRYVAKYEKASKCINPRDLHLDKPARTLTCRNLAGATGDMHRIKLKDGRRRRITVREAARLQSFPDWFNFFGTETQQFIQIGNSVAPFFAYHLAKKIKNHFFNITVEKYESNDIEQLKLFSYEETF